MSDDREEIIGAMIGATVLVGGGYVLYRILKSVAGAAEKATAPAVSQYTPVPTASTAADDDDYEDPERYSIHCYACGIYFSAASESASCPNCGN
jgi:hypothetical protein